MRRVRRRRLERLDDHLLDHLAGDRARPAGPRLIGQPVEPVLSEAVAICVFLSLAGYVSLEYADHN